ncbi:hypothetical protein ElyMa_002754300 [Elysia marginata]|uniref:Uncharacterized protein n=1 Tax=Elysia marginata TaxID=1093978 RepID=A0AAV4HMI4_9GAST|nr:hypothetical protein ElyMa_002754300 [Elysia marginata]
MYNNNSITEPRPRPRERNKHQQSAQSQLYTNDNFIQDIRPTYCITESFSPTKRHTSSKNTNKEKESQALTLSEDTSSRRTKLLNRYTVIIRVEETANTSQTKRHNKGFCQSENQSFTSPNTRYERELGFELETGENTW